MDENNYVVKANQFIQAKGRLGTLEQKLLATLISEIQITDEDFKEYKLVIHEVGEFIGLNNNAIYERLRETSNNLKNKALSFTEVDPITKKKTFIEVNLIASAKHTEGSGILIITIAPDLKPYLIAIKGEETPFTKYMIKNILKLNGSYSIRLYEVLKQWERIRKKKFEIKELKEMLGADEPSYNRFDNFERRVLKPAKNEINENTDIFIIYRKIKTGRKISHIEFEIETRVGCFDPAEEDHKKFEESGDFDYDFVRNNSGLGEEKFSRVQIHEIYSLAVKKTEKYGIDELAYIQMNYEYVKDRAKQGLFGYLIKSLEKDYAKAINKLK